MKLLDDASRDASFRLSRRGFVLTSAALAAMALVRPQAIVLASDTDFRNSAFMIVSRLVSPAASNARTGQALYDALRNTPDFDARLQALAKLASAPGAQIEALAAQLDATGQHALRDTLNRIVSAWYLGIVDNKTVAYQTALMYRATADVLSPPSYTHAGPLSWATSHPPAQVL
jgi:fructose 5-dehydrogenase small subunit